MPRHVLLSTEQPGSSSVWERALAAHGLDVRPCRPDKLAEHIPACSAVVLDAGASAYDEDELLTASGYVRAVQLPLVIQATQKGVVVDDVVHELASGLVARAPTDIEFIAAALARRVDRQRAQRFEFVSIAPDDASLLAINGDGRSLLLPRPVHAFDDGSDIERITLSDDASSVTLTLTSGASFALVATEVAPAESLSQVRLGTLPVDRAQLGTRLRELRREAGLTQAELARRTGIHRPNIARVEAGRHTPSLETLARIAAALGVPTTRVLSDG